MWGCTIRVAVEPAYDEVENASHSVQYTVSPRLAPTAANYFVILFSGRLFKGKRVIDGKC